MKNILFFLTATYPFGTGETFIENEIHYLAKRYDKVVLISNNTTDIQTRSIPENVELIRFQYELSSAQKLKSLSVLFSNEIWRELSFVRKIYQLPISIEILKTILISWFNAKKIKKFVTNILDSYHDADITLYSYWANDSALAIAQIGWQYPSLKSIIRAHRWDLYFETSTIAFLPFRNYLKENIDHYTFISKHGLDYFYEKMKCEPNDQLKVSRLGTVQVAKDSIAQKRDFTIVSCSNLIPVKRVSLIAKALQQSTMSLTWVHIGDGIQRKKINQLCTELSVNIKVEFKGAVPNKEVITLYHEIKPTFLINVSESEGLPVSMMEAMSMGIPVVGTNVGGVNEIVEHKKNGLLLSENPQVDEILAAIDFFAALSDQEYQEITSAAWNTWNDKFNAAKNYHSFIDTLLAS